MELTLLKPSTIIEVGSPFVFTSIIMMKMPSAAFISIAIRSVIESLIWIRTGIALLLATYRGYRLLLHIIVILIGFYIVASPYTYGL